MLGGEVGIQVARFDTGELGQVVNHLDMAVCSRGGRDQFFLNEGIRGEKWARNGKQDGIQDEKWARNGKRYGIRNEKWA
jgi:hypothetical protein